MDRAILYALTCVLVLTATVAVTVSYRNLTDKPVKVEEPKAQRYRFDVVCPDGSRVGYVNTHRLPKSTLCQPDPQ